MALAPSPSNELYRIRTLAIVAVFLGSLLVFERSCFGPPLRREKTRYSQVRRDLPKWLCRLDSSRQSFAERDQQFSEAVLRPDETWPRAKQMYRCDRKAGRRLVPCRILISRFVQEEPRELGHPVALLEKACLWLWV